MLAAIDRTVAPLCEALHAAAALASRASKDSSDAVVFGVLPAAKAGRVVSAAGQAWNALSGLGTVSEPQGASSFPIEADLAVGAAGGRAPATQPPPFLAPPRA